MWVAIQVLGQKYKIMRIAVLETCVSRVSFMPNYGRPLKPFEPSQQYVAERFKVNQYSASDLKSTSKNEWALIILIRRHYGTEGFIPLCVCCPYFHPSTMVSRNLKGLWLCPNLWYADPLPSVLIPLLWKMRNVLNRMKNQFSDFFSSSYRENSSKIYIFFVKNDHNSKNKNRKIDHISKSKNITKNIHEYKNPIKNIAQFLKCI